MHKITQFCRILYTSTMLRRCFFRVESSNVEALESMELTPKNLGAVNQNERGEVGAGGHGGGHRAGLGLGDESMVPSIKSCTYIDIYIYIL